MRIDKTKILNNQDGIHPTIPYQEILLQGLNFLKSGDLINARQCMMEVIKQVPLHGDALHLLGIIHFKEKNYEYAIEAIEKAIAINPQNSDYLCNLGLVYKEINEGIKALNCFTKSLELNPHHFQACFNAALILKFQGNAADAVRHYQKALEISPHNPDVYFHLGNALLDLTLKDNSQEAFDKVISCYNRAIELMPGHFEAINNLGVIYLGLNQPDKGIPYLEKAKSIKPSDAGVRFNLAITYLVMGEFQKGWLEYEYRWSNEQFKLKQRSFPCPEWHGEALANKSIFIYNEQGVGDTLQFARFLPRIQQMGAKVILECHPSLYSLFEKLSGIDDLVTLGKTIPTFDYHLSINSLPGRLNISLSDLNPFFPLISIHHQERESWEKKLNHLALYPNGLKVGIVWAGAPIHINDSRRSMSLDHFSPILKLPNINFYSLQKGERNRDLEKFGAYNSLVDLNEYIHDFKDTAGIVSALDLVISVDTSVVHLAGSMGQKVWTLIPYVPDWRWLLNTEQSIWYPSMRLFRQPRQQDWVSVISMVKKELISLTNGN